MQGTFYHLRNGRIITARIIKRDGRRAPFSEEKLRAGMLRALEKRPVSVEQIESALARILRKTMTCGEREIPSEQIGLLVMDELQQLDQVAYVRFASVYRSFEDIDEFRKEISKLTRNAKRSEQKTMNQENNNNPPSASERHNARTYALQAMYQWQVAGAPIMDIEKEFLIEHIDKKIDMAYFKELIHGIPTQLDEIDGAIKPYLKRSMSDIDPVELAVLRVATYELLKRPDVPYRVIINEALQLTKKFGSVEGYRFVNGILDKIAKANRGVEINSGM